MVVLGGYDSATTLVAPILLKILSIPYLFWIESTRSERRLLRELAKPLLRLLVKSSQGVIVPGRAAREYALDLGAVSSHIFISPNSVDPTRFSPPEGRRARRELRDQLNLPTGVLFLFVGQLIERKGVRDAIEAFAGAASSDSNAHLVIVGDGPLRAPLLQRVLRDPVVLGHVHIRGYCSEEDLPRYYAACDAFVFPTHQDVWGFVLNEAMSSGLPVVSSDRAQAAKDLVHQGLTGFVVPSGDINALSGRMMDLLHSEELRIHMGQRARGQIVERFTPELAAARFVDAIRFVSERGVK